ncbi:hypothetical protein ACP70R_005770 [Stipagrostis hirtigluma subsp. patula]
MSLWSFPYVWDEIAPACTHAAEKRLRFASCAYNSPCTRMHACKRRRVNSASSRLSPPRSIYVAPLAVALAASLSAALAMEEKTAAALAMAEKTTAALAMAEMDAIGVAMEEKVAVGVAMEKNIGVAIAKKDAVEDLVVADSEEIVIGVTPCPRYGRAHAAVLAMEENTAAALTMAEKVAVGVAMEKDLVVADSEEIVTGVTPCPRCGIAHAMDREEWNRWHSRFTPCSRCGLVHLNYMVAALLAGLDEFDCEVLFPNLDDLKVEEDGAIILPDHLIELHDKLAKRRKLQDQKHAVVVEDNSMAGDT